MQIEIITTPLQLTVYGFGATAPNQDYAATAFRLSGKMWEAIKAAGLKNKGKNIWIYDEAHHVFAGVELEDAASGDHHGLEEKQVVLAKYAYYKHVGPYKLIGQTGQSMTREIVQQGQTVKLPYIEIYGHWTKDETQLETELFMCLK